MPNGHVRSSNLVEIARRSCDFRRTLGVVLGAFLYPWLGGHERSGQAAGAYRRMLTMNSGRYALIERSHDFALVPWRPVLERARGQVVTGSVGSAGISWSVGLRRGIGR
ncbi:DUF3363 domain-containing protein [Bradyrhizobium erythrophlei]|uniref:DUF3363 domain-containing protein n=1 Tax=Bradyrhizobium erythrophlei TaxID=1437360 RepID=UPI0035EA070A